MQIRRNRKGITIRCSVSEYEVLRALEQNVGEIVIDEPTKGKHTALNRVGKLFPDVKNLEETL